MTEENLERQAERALDHLTVWAEGNCDDHEGVLRAADLLLAVLEWAVATGRWQEAIRLGEAIEGAFGVGRRWGTWERVLNLNLHCARASGNRRAEAFALHQLGSRALCLDEREEARRYLQDALAIRESIGDEAGAEVTRRNLSLLSRAAEWWRSHVAATYRSRTDARAREGTPT